MASLMSTGGGAGGMSVLVSLATDPAQIAQMAKKDKATIESELRNLRISYDTSKADNDLDKFLGNVRTKVKQVQDYLQAANAAVGVGYTAADMATYGGKTGKFMANAWAQDQARGVATVMAASMGASFSATAMVGNKVDYMSAAQIMATKTPRQKMDEWARNYEATARKNAPELGPQDVVPDTMMDKMLKTLARRGPLVAGVVAAAVASSTIGAMAMAPIVQATHGGFSPTLAASAASQQFGLGILRGLGSIPLVGAAFSGMATRQEAEISWAQDAARQNAMLPFATQGFMAGAIGNTPTAVAAQRAQQRAQMIADQETARAKLEAMTGFSVSAGGRITGKSSLMGSGNYGQSIGKSALSDEQIEVHNQLLNLGKTLAAFHNETGTVVGTSRATFRAGMGGIAASGMSAAGMANIARTKMAGGSPIDIFRGESEIGYRDLVSRQAQEIAPLTGKAGYMEMGWAQLAQRSQFKANRQFEAMQTAFSAPMAWAGTAGEATGQSEISSLRMKQAQELGGGMETTYDAVIKAFNAAADKIVQALEGKSTYNGTN